MCYVYVYTRITERVHFSKRSRENSCVCVCVCKCFWIVLRLVIIEFVKLIFVKEIFHFLSLNNIPFYFLQVKLRIWMNMNRMNRMNMFY